MHAGRAPAATMLLALAVLAVTPHAGATHDLALCAEMEAAGGLEGPAELPPPVLAGTACQGALGEGDPVDWYTLREETDRRLIVWAEGAKVCHLAGQACIGEGSLPVQGPGNVTFGVVPAHPGATRYVLRLEEDAECGAGESDSGDVVHLEEDGCRGYLWSGDRHGDWFHVRVPANVATALVGFGDEVAACVRAPEAWIPVLCGLAPLWLPLVDRDMEWEVVLHPLDGLSPGTWYRLRLIGQAPLPSCGGHAERPWEGCDRGWLSADDTADVLEMPARGGAFTVKRPPSPVFHALAINVSPLGPLPAEKVSVTVVLTSGSMPEGVDYHVPYRLQARPWGQDGDCGGPDAHASPAYAFHLPPTCAGGMTETDGADAFWWPAQAGMALELDTDPLLDAHLEVVLADGSRVGVATVGTEGVERYVAPGDGEMAVRVVRKSGDGAYRLEQQAREPDVAETAIDDAGDPSDEALAGADLARVVIAPADDAPTGDDAGPAGPMAGKRGGPREAPGPGFGAAAVALACVAVACSAGDRASPRKPT